MAAVAAPPVPEELQLPKAVVKRLIKKQFAQNENPSIRDASISAEALLAFSEATKVFISYITCTANDIALEHKRQTVSVEDVFTALEELEFEEMVEPLKVELEKYRAESKEKAAAAKERAEARKAKAADEAADAGNTPAAATGPAMMEQDMHVADAGAEAAEGHPVTAAAGPDSEDTEMTEPAA